MINTFHNDTPEEVKSALLYAQESRERIRLFYGDTITGKSWNETNDVIGYVGNSTGSKKIPILVFNSRSVGGGSILDHCVIGIKTKNRWIYKHPSMDLGDWEVQEHSGRWEVLNQEGVYARFNSERKAELFKAFMLGTRFTK